MNSTQVLSAIRHTLTIAGTIAVTLGYTDAAHCTNAVNVTMQLVGEALVILGFVCALVNAARTHTLKQWWDTLAPSEQMAIKQEARRKTALGRALPMILMALMLPLFVTGCSQNAQVIEYRALGTIGATANTAHELWKAYAASGQAKAADIATVRDCWAKYVAAFDLAADAGAAIAQNGTNNTSAFQAAMNVVGLCEKDLVTLVTTLLPPDLAAKLNGTQ